MECPRCFYVDNKLGTARPPGYPFNLNNAVDELLKKEFDIHRANGTQHPLAKAYGVQAVPFAHEKLNEWRDALRHGISYHHPSTGLLVRGGIDDVWKDDTGALIIVDYKATSKNERIEVLDQEWHIGYKRQMEVYQWLFRQNGFQVNDTGYFVYANASKDREAFDGKLEFEVTLVPYVGNPSWVEGTLTAIKQCLDSDVAPGPALDCDYCRYREAAGKALLNLQSTHGGAPKKETPASTKKNEEETATESLF